jgi:hypothetical protein
MYLASTQLVLCEATPLIAPSLQCHNVLNHCHLHAFGVPIKWTLLPLKINNVDESMLCDFPLRS